MGELIHYEIGAYRVSREGRIDEGQDGLLWIPAGIEDECVPAVAAVADGVGMKGDGQEALSDFNFCFDLHRNLRDSVLDLLKDQHLSTFVGVQLPQCFENPGCIFSLGDSSAFKIQRRENRADILKTLTRPNNLLRDLLDEHDDLRCLIEQIGRKEQLSFESLDWLFKIVEPYVLECLEKKQRLFLSHHAECYKQTIDLAVKQTEVMRMLNGIFDIITMDLASPYEIVSKEIGIGKEFYLKPGDDVVLHTDGVNLAKPIMKRILNQHDPVEAAELMVKLSNKPDDRAVIVVRAYQKPRKQSFRKSVRLSLHSTQRHPGTRR